jgi:hypothetical protein
MKSVMIRWPHRPPSTQYVGCAVSQLTDLPLHGALSTPPFRSPARNALAHDATATLFLAERVTLHCIECVSKPSNAFDSKTSSRIR